MRYQTNICVKRNELENHLKNTGSSKCFLCLQVIGNRLTKVCPLDILARCSFDSFCFSFRLVKLPYFDVLWNEVRVHPNIISPKCLIPLFAEVPKYKQNLAKAGWVCVEEKHCLIPCCDLGTRHITALCPCVCLAFYENLIFVISEIKVMGFAPVNADLYRDFRCEVQPLPSEKSLCFIREVTADLSIAIGPFALEWFVHYLLFHQRTFEMSGRHRLAGGCLLAAMVVRHLSVARLSTVTAHCEDSHSTGRRLLRRRFAPHIGRQAGPHHTAE